jgi:hypothetical protein
MPAKPTATVFALAPGAKANALAAKEVGKADLKAAYSSLTPVTVEGQSLLFGYAPGQDHFDVYAFSAKAPWLRPLPAKPAIGKGKDIINAFTLGNAPYVCGYTAKNGIFEISSVAKDLSLSAPYRFYRNHELAVSHDFTTLKPFTQFGQVCFLGYRGDNGYVAMYSLSVVVSSPAPGVPPLLMLPVWSHPWAPGWTRFAFFQLGGETFFFKTNTKVLNVNIDHVLDTLSAGTTEVGTLLQAQLPDALKITNVEPIIPGEAVPHFVTYIAPTGAATVNRIHADCLGWTQALAFEAPAKAGVVTPVTLGEQAFLIFA